MRIAKALIYNGKAVRRMICLLLIFSVMMCSFIAFNLISKNSGAYLYDEQGSSIAYSVSKLSFDLSSNHMYTYYDDNGFDNIYQNKFESMLVSLSALKDDIDSARITIDAFDNSAIWSDRNAGSNKYLAEYYSVDFLDDLQKAWEDNSSVDEGEIHTFNQIGYNSRIQSIYTAYAKDYPYLFKIRSMDMQTVYDSGYSIWYFYVSDLLSMYFGDKNDGITRYVVQDDGTSVKQSTVKIGIKLKGGTTYNGLTSDEYYDQNFNDMVNAFTFNLKNTGSEILYLQYLVNMDPGAESADSALNKGIVGMLLPYGMDFSSLIQNDTYNDFYTAPAVTGEAGEWDYRGLIGELLSVWWQGSGNTGSYNFGQLEYADLQTIIPLWNAYAQETYQENLINDSHYVMVKTGETAGTDQISQINSSMILWADYQKNAEYYYAHCDNGAHAGDVTDYDKWRTYDEYGILDSEVYIGVRSSLNESADLTSTSDQFWAFLFNEKKEYDKSAAVSNFDVEGLAYFEQGDGTEYNPTKYAYEQNEKAVSNIVYAQSHMAGGYIECLYKADQTGEPNYIGKLRFNVVYRGFSPAYIRVRLIEQFTNSYGDIVAVKPLTFELGDGWHDNRADDLYFYSDQLYWSTDSLTTTTVNKAKQISIPIIKDFDIDSFNSELLTNEKLGENLKLKVTFYVEAVQPNRTFQYWGKSLSDIKAICNGQSRSGE